MGIMAATLASLTAQLVKPTWPRLIFALKGIAIALTLPLATWILWRFFA